MAQAIVFCGLRLLRPANPPTTKTIVCPAEQVAATTQWGGPPGLPSCCPAARRENRCDSLRIWRAAIQSICERFSNVRRGKKADREVRPTGCAHAGSGFRPCPTDVSPRASSKPLPLEERSSQADKNMEAPAILACALPVQQVLFP